jgi:hypothetical protein
MAEQRHAGPTLQIGSVAADNSRTGVRRHGCSLGRSNAAADRVRSSGERERFPFFTDQVAELVAETIDGLGVRTNGV